MNDIAQETMFTSR